MNINLDKVQKIAEKIQNNNYLLAISNGLMSTLPVLIIGALSLILASLPFAPYQNLIAKLGIKSVLALPSQFTIGLIAVYASFLIAYRLAESYKHDALSAGMISLISFFILTPARTFNKVDTIPFEWLGVKGLFVAMIVALLSTAINMAIVNRKIVIKMPDGVPPTVSKVFSSIIPAIIIIAIFTAIQAGFKASSFKTVHDLIYNFLQLPMQKIGGSYWGLVGFVVISQILWFFGIHGSMVTNVVAKPLLISMDLANLAAFQAGEPLPYIISWAFRFLYVLIGGCGSTLGLCFLMAFRAKSQQLRSLGKIALPMSISSINEPIVFGVPMVLNPLMFIPFVLTPLITMTIAYLVTAAGIVPIPIGIFLPLGMPVLISAFIEGGMKLVILQALLIVVTAVCYYPFFKKIDNDKYKEEQEQAQQA